MAEIRSTMDMVLERAERLCSTADDGSNSFDFSQDGMRTGAALLRGESINLAQKIDTYSPETKPSFIKGIMDTFLRTLVLPREEELLCEESIKIFTTL